jgi:FdrA protein
MLGLGQPDLTAAASSVTRRLGRPVPASWPAWHPASGPDSRRGALRGLFAGGTLCDEAMVIASAALGPIGSNIPLRPEWTLGNGHTMVDYGDDALTRGRPHPMIDNTVRLDRLAVEAADPSCGVILLDVVLGHAADPDPAAGLAPAIDAARTRGVSIVVSLIGTGGDPQGLHRQAEALCAAGASVFSSNADAARFATGLVVAP